MTDCLFCKMIRGEINPKIEYEDERVLAIHDLNPQAPVHLLIIPKKHIAKIGDMEQADIITLGTLLFKAKEIAAQQNWPDYRLVFNNGAQAQQTIYHIHLHLLSGRSMTWPPG